MTEEYGHTPDGFFLSQEEVNDLRKAKKELTEYAKQKLGELMETETPFYRFFAVDYFATGEGVSYWLKVCRNYEPINDRDYEMEKFKEFLGHSHYYPGIEELTEEQFLEKYAKLIPDHTRMMIHRRDQPIFTWETHVHFNYS